MMKMKLEGSVSVVTGAGSGLGREIALGLAKEGSIIVVNDIGPEKKIQAVVNQIHENGGMAMAYMADTSRKSEVVEMFLEIVEKFGKVDVLVNNAGIAYSTPFLEISEQEWDHLISVNVKGYFLCGQAAAFYMAKQKRGKIINISSTRQEQPWPGNAHYCASKGAIYMLTRTMALELGPLGINVNSIAPGTIPTNLNSAVNDPKFREERISKIPLGRLGTAQDVVGAAVLLASSESDFIHGASLMIDGGQTLT